MTFASHRQLPPTLARLRVGGSDPCRRLAGPEAQAVTDCDGPFFPESLRLHASRTRTPGQSPIATEGTWTRTAALGPGRSGPLPAARVILSVRDHFSKC